MCGPLALPLALLAAGTGTKLIADRQARKAVASVGRRENARQEALQKEALSLAEQNRDKFTRGAADGGLADAIAQRMAMYQRSDAGEIPVEIALGPTGDSGDQRVLGAVAEATSRGRAAAGAEGNARARLNSLGDWLQGATLEAGRNTNQIGTLANFGRASAGVNQLELAAAQQKGGGLRALGDMLTLAGSVAAPAAAGFGAGSTAAAGTTLNGAAAVPSVGGSFSFTPNFGAAAGGGMLRPPLYVF